MPDQNRDESSKDRSDSKPNAGDSPDPAGGEAQNRAEAALQVEQDARLAKTKADSESGQNHQSHEGVNPDG